MRLGAAGDKPGAEGGEERANLADKDQEGVQQVPVNPPAEQRAAYRRPPRQVQGSFSATSAKAAPKSSATPTERSIAPAHNDKSHRHRHDQQNRALPCSKLVWIVEGQKYRVRPAEQGNPPAG